MHLRKLALTLPKLCHKTQRIKLHPVNTIMKSFMAFILDQILVLLFMEKNSQIYGTYMAQVAKLFQYLLACNFKLCSVNTAQFLSLTFPFNIHAAGLYLRHFWSLHL